MLWKCINIELSATSLRTLNQFNWSTLLLIICCWLFGNRFLFWEIATFLCHLSLKNSHKVLIAWFNWRFIYTISNIIFSIDWLSFYWFFLNSFTWDRRSFPHNLFSHRTFFSDLCDWSFLLFNNCIFLLLLHWFINSFFGNRLIIRFLFFFTRNILLSTHVATHLFFQKQKSLFCLIDFTMSHIFFNFIINLLSGSSSWRKLLRSRRFSDLIYFSFLTIICIF